MSIEAVLVNAPANVFVVFNGAFAYGTGMMAPNNAEDQSWGIVVTANIGEVLVEEHNLDPSSVFNALDVINTGTEEGAIIWYDARELITFLHSSLDLLCSGAWNEQDAAREIEGSTYTDVKVTFMRD